MSDWLRNFDRVSFWLGFIAASLFWFLVSRVRPALEQWRIGQRAALAGKRHERSLNDEIRLANDMLRLAQGGHVGAPLFALDEVLIPPRLLAPPLPPQAYEPPPSEDITDWAIPSMPDWPELASYYGAPWLTPAEALRGGANLAIIGQPGSGKSVALAYLVSEIIRKDPAAGEVAELSPALVHIGAIFGGDTTVSDPVEQLIAAIAPNTPSIPARRLPGFIRGLLGQNRLLLLLDGLDELSPEQLDDAADWLERLLKTHPKLRAVVTAHPERLGRLPQLGFQPIPLVAWGAAQRTLLITRWSDLWNQHIAAEAKTKSPSADPLLVIGWLLNNTANLTPQELTLKVWAALAGDSLGQGPLPAFESYLRRMMVRQPAKHRSGFEQRAAQALLAGQPMMERSAAERWLGGAEVDSPASEPILEFDAPSGGEKDGKKGQKVETVRARGALPDLLESGLLVQYGSRVGFQNPALLGYLAAQRLSSLHAGAQAAALPEWSGRAAALSFLSVLDGQGAWLADFLRDNPADPVQRNLLQAARWLRGAPESLPWISPAMRTLALALHREQSPLGLKLRLLTALALSGNSGVPVLLRQLSTAPASNLRRMAALGLGMVRDPKATPDLVRLAGERIPGIYHAAVLALVAVADKTGLEAVAGLLLSGDESQSRAAAEALANNAEEGHPTLDEASRLEDPGVRRAAVFGLGRVRQEWSTRILEKLRSEDPQWAVQDAAGQILQAVEESHPRLPRALPPLTHLPWLVAFAAERGMGISPGKPAYEMLYRTLKEGSEDQIQAAVYYLTARGNEGAVLPLYQLFFADRGELREQAYEALLSLSARGVPLPEPNQYGLR